MVANEMKLYTIFVEFGCLCIFALLLPARCSHSKDLSAANQAKRDLSLSYAATNIDSKEGTRVKTITVIKNIGGENKQQPLAIDPELHKDEEWGSAFRDNFDSYGKIPDVPDIDDLFNFMKMKSNNNNKNNKMTTALPSVIEENEKPVMEDSVEEADVSLTSDKTPAEKIKGDAELLPSNGSKQHDLQMATSESISMTKYNTSPKPKTKNDNSSTSDDSTKQHFDKYVQLSSSGYAYNDDKPCEHGLPESISIRSASGHSYDVPVSKQSRGKPYIAPALAKRRQARPQINQPGRNLPVNRPQYSVNSILPPLSSLLGKSVSYQFQSNNRSQHVRDVVDYPTAASAYVVPNLGTGLVASQPAQRVYRADHTKKHTNTLSLGNANRMKNARSRGLRY